MKPFTVSLKEAHIFEAEAIHTGNLARQALDCQLRYTRLLSLLSECSQVLILDLFDYITFTWIMNIPGEAGGLQIRTNFAASSLYITSMLACLAKLSCKP